MPTAASVNVDFTINVDASGLLPGLAAIFASSDSMPTLFETAEFTPMTGSSLVVFVDFRHASSLVGLTSATYGPAGRAVGTGTAFPIAHLTDLQGITTHLVFVLPNMVATPMTVQIETDTTTRSQVITVVEVPGAAMIQDGASSLSSGGAANTDLTLALTTLYADSFVLYHMAKDFAPGEAVTLAGATELASGDTGEASLFNDLQHATAFVATGPAGAQSVQATWATGENVIGSAVEIRR